MAWLEVFRAGKFPQGDFTEANLDEIVSNFDAKERPAPLVIGHPKHNHPAFGWVARVKRVGQALMAEFADVHSAVKQAVKNKAYTRVSVRLVPTESGWTLRHVGLLGAVAPQIAGLPPVEFAEHENAVQVELDFKEAEVDKENQEQMEARIRAELAADFASREKALAQQEAALKRRGLDQWASDQVEAGRLLPAQSTAVVDFMLALEMPAVDFTAAEGTVKRTDWFRSFVEALPKRPELQTVAGASSAPERVSADFAAPEGTHVDPERAVLHGQILQYAKQHKVDYTTAMKAVR